MLPHHGLVKAVSVTTVDAVRPVALIDTQLKGDVRGCLGGDEGAQLGGESWVNRE